MADDLRSVPPEDHWRALREMMGDGGLLTYRYLGRTVNTGGGPAEDRMRLRRDMRDASGGIMAAPLAIATADAGGFTDMETVPAPVSVSVNVLEGAHDVGEIIVRQTVLHTGRTLGFSRSEVVDAADPSRVIATTAGTGVRLADAPSGFEPIDPPSSIEDSDDLPPLHEVFGAERRGPGVWELPALGRASASTSGSLHLGPIHIVLEAAARDVAGAAALQVEHWAALFVSAGRVGPFITRSSLQRGRGGRVGASVELRDTGSGDRLVASASAAFRAGDAA